MSALTGSVAVVTGAGQGIGAAIAAELAGLGAAVAVTDVDLAAAEATAAGIAGAAPVAMDVTDRGSVEDAARRIAAEIGTVDVLVNNAGINRVGPSVSLPEADWQAVLDVNLTAVFRCCQVFGAGMLAAGRGAVVNVASINGARFGMPGRAAYCASKAGVVGLTRALAAEWAPHGVRVNAVEPGYVRTPMIDNALRSGLLDEQEMLDRIPAGRLAEPEDVARAVADLVSPRSGYIVGQTIVVDGGYLAYGAAAPVSRTVDAEHRP